MSDEDKDKEFIRLGEHSPGRKLAWTIGKNKEGRTVLKPPGAEHYEKKIAELKAKLAAAEANLQSKKEEFVAVWDAKQADRNRITELEAILKEINMIIDMPIYDTERLTMIHKVLRPAPPEVK